MPVQAIAKKVSQSPRKVAVVASLVRGRSVAEAITILEHTPRRSSIAVKKVIESARANADYNHNYKPASLRIVEITVTPGPRQKRFRPASRGVAQPYQKKSSHIKVVVDGELRASVSSKKIDKSEKTTNDKITGTIATKEKK